MQTITKKYFGRQTVHKMIQILKLNKSPFSAMILTQMKSLRIDELDMAIKRFKRNKAPGPDGTTAGLYRWLDPNNRATLLDTITNVGTMKFLTKP